MNNCTIDLMFHHKFPDGFECGIALNGRIWIKYPEEKCATTPCMKCCYDVIKMRSVPVAKYVLAKSCEIQGNKDILERAEGYESL